MSSLPAYKFWPFLLLLAAAVEATGVPVEIVTPDLQGAKQPQVAVAPSGRVHVTFGAGNTVYHVSSSDGGKTFSSPVKVGEVPKLALGMRRGPRVTATDKVIAIAAISHEPGDLLVWSSADGAAWQAAKVNDTTQSAREGLHALAGNGSGSVFVTWLDDRNKSKELWGAASRDGGVSWGANKLIYKSPDGHICECCNPSAAMDARGRVAVMWRNWLGGARDMYAVLSSDGGQTFAAPQKLGSGTWKVNGCPMDGGAIALDAKGAMLTAWRRDKTAFATGSIGSEQRLGEPALQPIVVPSATGPYYFWESGGGLMMQKGSARPTRLAEQAASASGAALPGKGVVVVWQSEAGGKKTLLAEVVQ